VDGFLVPPADPDTLAERISTLLADDDKRRDMGRLGAQKVRREWTFAAQARAYQALFEQLTQARSANQSRAREEAGKQKTPSPPTPRHKPEAQARGTEDGGEGGPSPAH
jgi:hypothetical protein